MSANAVISTEDHVGLARRLGRPIDDDGLTVRLHRNGLG
jgi:hypothetical protein